MKLKRNSTKIRDPDVFPVSHLKDVQLGTTTSHRLPKIVSLQCNENIKSPLNQHTMNTLFINKSLWAQLFGIMLNGFL